MIIYFLKHNLETARISLDLTEVIISGDEDQERERIDSFNINTTADVSTSAADYI